MTKSRIAGTLLAVLGAVGVTASAYLNWADDREARDYPIDRLFQSDAVDAATSYWSSIALPLALVTALAVVGVLLQSRLVAAVGLILGALTVALFIVQSLEGGLSAGDLQAGVWVAITGAVVMTLGLGTMGTRPKPVEVDEPISVLQDPNARFVERAAEHQRTGGSAPAVPAELGGVQDTTAAAETSAETTAAGPTAPDTTTPAVPTEQPGVEPTEPVERPEPAEPDEPVEPTEPVERPEPTERPEAAESDEPAPRDEADDDPDDARGT